MAEPMLRVWMQESAAPESFHKHRPGRWIAEAQWPSPRIKTKRLWLNLDGLREAADRKVPLDVRSPQTVGFDGGEWCGFGLPGEAPRDQRRDDEQSLVFDSEPLPERLEIFGAPLAVLELAADRPVALLAVRLNDVAADGTSQRVTYGLLNLTHRQSHQRPLPVEPGERYVLRLALNDVAHAFPAGHRIRIAISAAYWPVVWPAPHPVTLTVFTGDSFLELPARPSDTADAELRPFKRPERAAAETMELKPAPLQRIIEHDAGSGETVYAISEGGQTPPLLHIEAIGLEVVQSLSKRYRIAAADPQTARAEVIGNTVFRRGAWQARVQVRSALSSTLEDFILEAELAAYENDELFFSRAWSQRIKRSLL
jgi:hypothetical protein